YLRLERNDELIGPSTFLGIAAEHGLTAEIDRWVVSRAIAVIGERQRAGHATSLLVKVSPEAFADTQMVDLIRRELATHGVPGDRLWLQTPEAKVFTHLRNAQQFLADATALDCKVGL
ncbi:EAL domain-containing protein, partial [Pantoea dispersa]